MPADNSTMKAIHDFFKNGVREATQIVSFTSVNKFSAVVFDSKTLIIGAPEMVLRDQFAEYKD